MEDIDHDYLSTQVIQIPSKSKTSFSSSFIFQKSPELSIPALCLLCKMSYREVARERTQFLMTNLQISAILQLLCAGTLCLPPLESSQICICS